MKFIGNDYPILTENQNSYFFVPSGENENKNFEYNYLECHNRKLEWLWIEIKTPKNGTATETPKTRIVMESKSKFFTGN